jgi:hypothetical protein
MGFDELAGYGAAYGACPGDGNFHAIAPRVRVT